MAQPKIMLEPMDPHETHQFDLSLQSQVPSTAEPILAHLSSHISINTKSLDTKYQTNLPLSHKAETSATKFPAPVNQAATPHSLVSQAATPHTQINLTTATPEFQADPPLELVNQTAPPSNLDIQAEFGIHDLKRKDHPDSPTSIPKKSRLEDACIEDGSIQLLAEEVAVLHNDVEGYGKSNSLFEEAGLHLSPNAPWRYSVGTVEGFVIP
ncbi:hypothetical protein FCV25MIE_34626 [Fagus crenata]